MGRIKSVIFDWGGVLIDNPAPALMQYCARALSVSEQQYIRAHSKFADDFQKGSISEDTFWSRVCSRLNRPLPDAPSLWAQAFRAVYSPRAEVFAMACLLHNQGYRTALLSNTEVPAMQFFFQLQYDMFDVAVFSCAEGAQKPEGKIYEITLHRLGSAPEQTVFIDDKPEHINGAKQRGLNTILFKDIKQVKKQLARFGVVVD